MSTKSVIFVLGGPGSGKGTQAKAIAEQYNIGYASAGDILRAEAKDVNSPNRETIAKILDAGQLVPPSLICQTIKKTIETSPQKYFLMDGFPRSLEQDNAFREIIPADMVAAVALLDAPDDVLVKRCVSRGQSSGRSDDNEETTKTRIQVYKGTTMPVVEEYRQEGKVFEINADQTIEQVRADFVNQLKKYWTF